MSDCVYMYILLSIQSSTHTHTCICICSGIIHVQPKHLVANGNIDALCICLVFFPDKYTVSMRKPASPDLTAMADICRESSILQPHFRTLSTSHIRYTCRHLRRHMQLILQAVTHSSAGQAVQQFTAWTLRSGCMSAALTAFPQEQSCKSAHQLAKLPACMNSL